VSREESDLFGVWLALVYWLVDLRDLLGLGRCGGGSSSEMLFLLFF